MIARVLGSADSLDSDVRRLDEMVGGFSGLTVCVNDTGVHWPSFDAWASIHPERYWEEVLGTGDWLRRREEDGHPPVTALYGPRRKVHPDLIVHRQRWAGGSSGLYAADVAKHGLGARAVVLCGVPLDERPHRWHGRDWTEARAFRLTWEKRESELSGWLTSMSGWTRDFLGEPTAESLGVPV